jgi:hypothetical protein
MKPAANRLAGLRSGHRANQYRLFSLYLNAHNNHSIRSSTIRHSPFAIRPSAIRHSPFAHPPFAIRHSLIRHSPFTIRHSLIPY